MRPRGDPHVLVRIAAREIGLEVLTGVVDLFLKGASVGEASRVKPGEKRGERFNLPSTGDARAVVVRLEYRDSSLGTVQTNGCGLCR